MKLHPINLLLCAILSLCALTQSAQALVVAPENPEEAPAAVVQATATKSAVEQALMAPAKPAPKTFNRLLAIRSTAGEKTALKGRSSVQEISREVSPAVVVERKDQLFKPWMGLAVLIALAAGLIVTQIRREAARKREHEAKLAASQQRQAPFLKKP